MVVPLRFLHFRFLILVALMVEAGAASEITWDARMASFFSGRLNEIQNELTLLAPQIDALPGIPINDQGGTGGFANIHPTATPGPHESDAVEVRWPAPTPVDLVALVPARCYDAKGLDAQYGMPNAFKVELINSSGKVIACVGREQNTRSRSVRKGYPFVYQISPPLEASGLRISAESLPADSDGEGTFVHAWAEVFAFNGEHNIAMGAEVKSLGGSARPAPWHWNAAFLVDGQTPMGLPEIPDKGHANIGWISEGRDNSNQSASLILDLGKSLTIDAVRLLPAKKPTSDLPSGFGFPRKLAVSISDSGTIDEPDSWSILATRDLLNPGHNPLIVSFKATRGRYVKIEATQLWKAFDSYPAFFALSEVEILNGDQNLALGKAVRSSDGMLNLMSPGGKFWSSAALSDGFGPDGRLVSTREWMIQLDQRQRLESRSDALNSEATRLVSGWRSAGLTAIAVFGLLGSFLIIALPIRYRIHAKRQLIKVRERIASDLHDEVGSNLGSIQMFVDLAEGRADPSDDLKRIQRIAAETVSAVRDIVWLLRPQGDHRIGTVDHLRETSSIMLESLKWKFTSNEDALLVELAEDANRHLFLFFREALHNIIRHAHASIVKIHAELSAGHFEITIQDDGIGIDPERLERPATLHALRQRAATMNATLAVESQPTKGTCLKLTVPLPRRHLRKNRQWD